MKCVSLLLASMSLLSLALSRIDAQEPKKEVLRDQNATQRKKAPAPATKKTTGADLASTNSLWASFRKSTPGRYCFYHDEKQGQGRTHNAYLIVTIDDTTLRVEQGGVIQPGGNTFFYREELTGTLNGTKIAAIFSRTKEKAEFTFADKALENDHFLTKEKTTYMLKTCITQRTGTAQGGGGGESVVTRPPQVPAKAASAQSKNQADGVADGDRWRAVARSLTGRWAVSDMPDAEATALSSAIELRCPKTALPFIPSRRPLATMMSDGELKTSQYLTPVCALRWWASFSSLGRIHYRSRVRLPLGRLQGHTIIRSLPPERARAAG